MLTLLILYCLVGCLLIGLALPLWWRKIKPNAVYGFRVQATLDNPRIWYAANEYSAKRLVVAGLSIVVAAVGLYAVPGISVEAYSMGCLAVFGVVLGIGVWQSFRYLRSLV